MAALSTAAARPRELRGRRAEATLAVLHAYHGSCVMGKGTLKVLVKQATNLKDSQWIGKQDPFAIVWAGPYSSRTKVHFGTKASGSAHLSFVGGLHVAPQRVEGWILTKDPLDLYCLFGNITSRGESFQMAAGIRCGTRSSHSCLTKTITMCR